MIEEKTVLGEIFMEDGKTYKIRSMVKGKLLEMNDAVAKNLDLLKLSVTFFLGLGGKEPRTKIA